MESGGTMAIAIPKQFAGFGLAVAIISVANHFGLVDLFAQSATRAIEPYRVCRRLFYLS